MVSIISADIGQVTASFSKWKGGAQGAYSIIHDDLCLANADGILDNADTIAFNRGLTVGSGAIVGQCMNRTIWVRLRAMASHGHEIISHSWGHPYATSGSWDPKKEIVASKRTLEDSIPGTRVSFFIFPYDAYDDQDKKDLRDAGYLGARVGPQVYNDRGLTTNFVNFNPFGSIFFSIFYHTNSAQSMNDYANSAVTKSGWGLKEMHGVGDASWESCPVAVYRAHLDYLKSKTASGVLWVGTPTQVVKYIVSIDKGGTVAVNGNTLSFPGAVNIPDAYATELTVQITTTGNSPTMFARQDTANIAVRTIATNRFSIDVNPKKGSVVLSEKNTARVSARGERYLPYSLRSSPSTITAVIPSGAYHINITNVKGQAVCPEICGITQNGLVSARLPQTMAPGLYLITISAASGNFVKSVIHHVSKEGVWLLMAPRSGCGLSKQVMILKSVATN